jgi:hypothetical protein
MSEPLLSEETLTQRKLMRNALRKGRRYAQEWAARSGLKHWHEAGYGCSEACLEGIEYQPDPDRVRIRPAMPLPGHRKGNFSASSAARLRRESPDVEIDDGHGYD